MEFWLGLTHHHHGNLVGGLTITMEIWLGRLTITMEIWLGRLTITMEI